MATKNHAPAAGSTLSGVKIATSAFRDALSFVRAFAERDGHPVFRFFSISIGDEPGVARFRSIGMTATAETKVDGVEGQGAALLPTIPVTAFLSAADSDMIEIETKADRVVLTAGDLVVSVIPIAASDAPDVVALPERSNARPIPLAEGVLSWLLALTAPFVSSEETRYYLNGVAFEIADESLIAVATDGHRLGFRKTSCAGMPDMAASIVPRDVVPPLAHFAKGREVVATFTEKLARFEIAGKGVVTAKLIDGTFPNWRRVVPTSNEATVEVDTARLTKFFKAAEGIYHRDRFRALRLSVKDGVATASMDSPAGGSLSLPLQARVDDKDCDRGMNVRYARDIVRALGSRRIRFDLARGDHGSPMIIRDPDSKAEEFVVLMPMRV